VILHGEHIGEAKEFAQREHASLRYINGYDDVEIIAGAGTMGIEILDQVSDVDVILVPVGGAGLIAGVSLAVKTIRPHVQVIGVEPENVILPGGAGGGPACKRLQGGNAGRRPGRAHRGPHLL